MILYIAVKDHGFCSVENEYTTLEVHVKKKTKSVLFKDISLEYQ